MNTERLTITWRGRKTRVPISIRKGILLGIVDDDDEDEPEPELYQIQEQQQDSDQESANSEVMIPETSLEFTESEQQEDGSSDEGEVERIKPIQRRRFGPTPESDSDDMPLSAE